MKKLFVVLGLFMMLNVTCLPQTVKRAEKNNNISEIIFWSPNSELSLEILNSTSLLELLNKYDVHVILDLHLFSKYDKESNSLYLYTHSDNLDYNSDEFVFNPAYNFMRSYRSVFSKISYRNSLFSIVVDGKIVMNGLNRVFHDSPTKFEYDDVDIPKIYYEQDNSFRICYKFYKPFKHYNEMEKRKEKVLYIKELDDYFSE